MLDKVTGTAMCRMFFFHCWCIMREI